MAKISHPQSGLALLYSFNTKQKGFYVIVLIWTLVILLSLFYIFLIGSSFQGGGNELKVVSYNIWNYHSYWSTRKKGVADVIRNAYPDIVLLQEVRASYSNKQLDDLMNLIPFLKYSAFAVATPKADDGSSEGIGILSRYPIIETDFYNFTVVPSDPDRNTRTCLSATIDVPGRGKVQVYVSHLSYEKTTQCRQISELLKFVEKEEADADCSKQIPKIVAGDFNIYADFEAPSDILTKPITRTNPCFSHLDHNLQNSETENSAKFTDVWRSLYPDDPGLTFSLMPFKDAEHFVPSKGLESRPDRIYLKTDSCVLRPISIHKTAGESYEVEYYSEILFKQLFVHLTAAGGWPYVIYGPPILFIVFALFRVPRFYLLFALTSAVYIYLHVKNFPSNPDDFHPSDHLALISTFAWSSS